MRVQVVHGKNIENHNGNKKKEGIVIVPSFLVSLYVMLIQSFKLSGITEIQLSIIPTLNDCPILKYEAIQDFLMFVEHSTFLTAMLPMNRVSFMNVSMKHRHSSQHAHHCNENCLTLTHFILHLLNLRIYI